MKILLNIKTTERTDDIIEGLKNLFNNIDAPMHITSIQEVQ